MVGADLVNRALVSGTSVTWPAENVKDDARDFYSGAIGIFFFLARLQQARPDPALRQLLEVGAPGLQVSKGGTGLCNGPAGRAATYLELHAALGGTRWLEAAQADALKEVPMLQSTEAGAWELLYGHAGRGMLFLRLHALTGEARWLEYAEEAGQRLLAGSEASVGGLRWPGFLANGVPRYYFGQAHGAAGIGQFLIRLAEVLGSKGTPYREGSDGVGRYLIARNGGSPEAPWWDSYEGRTPSFAADAWCHGAPGVGMFFAEHARVTRSSESLRWARRCAAMVSPRTYGHQDCLCHGNAGNLWLLQKMHLLTGEATYLDAAQRGHAHTWSLRLPESPFPRWHAGDGSQRANPGLMVGNAGVGHALLSLHDPRRFPFPITE